MLHASLVECLIDDGAHYISEMSLVLFLRVRAVLVFANEICLFFAHNTTSTNGFAACGTVLAVQSVITINV